MAKRAKLDPELKPLRALQRAPAAMTEAQMWEIDKRFIEAPYGMYRRAGLASLKFSGKELIEKIGGNRKEAVTFAHMADWIDEGVKAHRMLANDIEIAAWRIRVALCTREDMESVIADAKKM